MRTITILAAAVAATLSAAPAFAQGAPVRSVAVSYADLDLNTEAGRNTLDARIRNAVRELCGYPSSVDLRGQNRVAQCRDELTARASLQRDVALAARQQSATSIAIRR